MDHRMAGSYPQSPGMLEDFPGRSPRRAWMLALLFAANGSLGTVVYLLGLLQDGQPLWVIDFPSFFMAADATFNHGLSPYAEATRSTYQQALGFIVLPFLYPPYALPALYPFSLLGYTSGVVVALALNTLAAVVLFRLLHQAFLVGIRRPIWYWAVLFLLFGSSSVRETIFVGQVNLVAVLSLLWAWRLLRGGAQPILAGLLIGIAVVTKTYFILLLLLFLPRLEWRPMLGAAIGILAFTVVAAMLLPLPLWAEWLIDVAPSGRYGTTPFPQFPSLLSGNQSINSSLIRLMGTGEAAGALCVGISATLLAVVGIVLWRRRATAAAIYFDAMFPLMLVTIYLVAPLSWMHHLLFVIPALLHLWAAAAGRDSRKEMVILVVVGIWIALPWPLPRLEDISTYLTLVPVPGIVALWLLCLRHAVRRPEEVRLQTTGASAPAAA